MGRRFYSPRIPLGNTTLVIPSAPLNISLSGPSISQINPSGTLQANYGFYGAFHYANGINASTFTGGDSGIISGLASDGSDRLKGLALMIKWRGIDVGTSSASYDFSTLTSYINAIKAKNKQYWIWIMYDTFGGTTKSVAAGTKCVPDWLINQQGLNGTMGNYNPIGSGVFPKWYNAPVKNAFVALLQAIVNQFGADPNFEGVAIGIGTSTPQQSQNDTNGTNYNSDYSDTGMIAGWSALMPAFRSMTSTANFWATTDYLFDMGGASSYTTSNQDGQWVTIFNTAVANKCAIGAPDTWTKNWIYPNTPFSSTGQNSYAPNNTVSQGGTYRRGIYADEILRGWRGPTPGVGLGYRGQVLHCGCEEITEMGGYIGQFSAADIWQTRGPALDNCHYLFFDINYAQSGNYGTDPNNTPGAPLAPNTLWNAAASYESTYGQSVYTWIKTSGVQTNQVNPYANAPLNHGDLLTINLASVPSPPTAVPIYMFAGGKTGEIESTAVGATPNFGHNTQSGTYTAGAFNWDRFSQTCTVRNDATRGKVIGHPSTSECCQGASFPQVVGNNRKIYIRYWARYAATVVSDSPDAQVKLLRLCAGSNIQDQGNGFIYNHWNHAGGPNHFVEQGIPNPSDPTSDQTQPDHETWYMGNNAALEQFDGAWRVSERRVITNSATGAYDGQYWWRCCTPGVAAPAFPDNTSASGHLLHSQVRTYLSNPVLGVLHYDSTIWQNFSSNGMSNMDFSIDDHLIQLDTFGRWEIRQTLTSSTGEFQPMTAVNPGVNAQIRINRGALGAGTYKLCWMADVANADTILYSQDITLTGS